MTTATLIAASDFCRWYNVEYAFIRSLWEAGLVEVTMVDEDSFIAETELQKLEKMIRLHHELEINLAGIEAITHLLQRLEETQFKMLSLKNRLRLYEGD